MSTTNTRLLFGAVCVFNFSATVSSFSLAPEPQAQPQQPSLNDDVKQLFPFQKAGVERLVSDRRVLLADEMGLGKTVQAIAALNRLYDEGELSPYGSRILVVCPKTVVHVWVDELGRWIDDQYVAVDQDVHVISAGSGKNNIGPLSVESSFGTIQIINYEVCHKYKDALQEALFDVLICDEAHYLKSMKSQRTESIIGLGNDCKGIRSTYLWLLTGTPIMNRPIELYPLLWAIDADQWPSVLDFADRYCQSDRKGFNNNRFGSEYDGASNLGELQRRLEQFMIRRYKSDLLLDLPPKLRSVVALDGKDAVARERQIINDMVGGISFPANFEGENPDGDEPTTLTNLATFGADASSLKAYGIEPSMFNDKGFLGQLANIRRETSLLKLDPAVEILKERITCEKVVVFAHHRELILDLVEAFGDSAVHIIGGMASEKRAEAVRRFQHDDSCRIFIGSIRAAGVGVTLTAASHVVFLELDWSPAIMAQAEDRCHRVGQRDSVQVDYYVFKGTIDEWVARQLMQKTQEISNALPEEVGGNTSQHRHPGRGYKLDFGKHKGLRVEDLPHEYLTFIREHDNGNVWRKKPDLWDALFRCGLVHEEPPPFPDPGRVEDGKMEPSEECEINYIFDFGKYTGKEWGDVPKSYKMWILKDKIWKNRARLWNALFDACLVEDEPPSEDTSKPQNNEVEKSGVHVEYTFDFGKHVGKEWKDVPKAYREWLLAKGIYNGRPDLKKALLSSNIIE